MGKKKVLLIDDDDEICDLIDVTLHDKGYDTVRAENGRQGYVAAKLHSPDLIITDVEMPLVNGLELCEMVRKDKTLHMTPIIMLTGSRTHPADRIAGLKIGADDYILKPFYTEELSLRVDRLIARAEEHISVNSLTKLPGSFTLEAEATKRLESKKPFSACYFDLNQFKSYNDHYGYAKGDVVIKLLADILMETLKELGNEDDVLIHIGGDDFILLTTPEKAEPIGRRVIERFTVDIIEHYNEEDRKRGFITTTNRKGQEENFPIMTISVAVISTGQRDLNRYEQMVDVLCELKKHAKSQQGSAFVQDRRSK